MAKYSREDLDNALTKADGYLVFVRQENGYVAFGEGVNFALIGYAFSMLNKISDEELADTDEATDKYTDWKDEWGRPDFN